MAADDFIDRMGARTAKLLARLAKRLEKDLERIIAKLDTDEGRLENTRHNAAQIRAIRRQVIEVAQREGMKELVKQLEKDLPKLVDEVLRDFPDLGDFNPDIKADLDRLFKGQAEEIGKLFGNAADDIALAVQDAVTGSKDISRLVSRVADKLDTSFGRAFVATDTAIRGYARTATVEQGESAKEAGVEFVYFYGGPEDKVTRPFCDEHIGKAFTKEALDELDNGQIGPVSAFMGGYRCRHFLAPMTVEQAEEDGIEVVR
jgi:hypothetical protein